MNSFVVRFSSVAAVFMIVLSLGFVLLGLNVGLSVSYGWRDRVLSAAQVFCVFYVLWSVCLWVSWSGFRFAARRLNTPVAGYASIPVHKMAAGFFTVTIVVALMVAACLNVTN